MNTFQIDTQFMLGPGVMIVPILEENYSKDTIVAYLPKGWWYYHHSPTIIESLGEEQSLDVPEDAIPVMYKGGSIIMKQDPGQNTKESRKNKFHIEIFLSENNNATGEFFWDDGVSNRTL